MKLWLFIVLVFIGLSLFGAYALFQNKKARDLWNPRSEPVLGQSVDGDEGKLGITVSESEYEVSWVAVADTINLSLVSNLVEKEPASKLLQTHNCSVLVNAGFYTQNFEPVGQFIVDYDEHRGFSKNSLFHGVLSINHLDTPRIMRSKALEGSRIAVQSGPILEENNSIMNLSIRNDYKARRVLAAVNGANQLYFLTVYNKNQVFSGPLLAELPSVLQEFEKTTSIDFADAINLDGGSASAFYTKTTSLSELSPIGSFFCYTGN